MVERLLDDLLSSLKLWMVGWRDDLQPIARKQMEDLIAEYEAREEPRCSYCKYGNVPREGLHYFPYPGGFITDDCALRPPPKE